MHITVLTLYPNMFPGPLGQGILEKARLKNLWSLSVINIRDFAEDAHKTVDEQSFGGGAGMVMRADVVDRALAAATKNLKSPRLVYLSARGKPFHQAYAKDWSHMQDSASARPLVLLCGRFEGVDQRVIDHWAMEEVAIGDFVLMGGEAASMIIIEACVRLVPGVLGNASSTHEESFEDNLLEYPQFTRPRIWKDKEVPSVLLSGHHQDIYNWRFNARCAHTKKMRPDLWKRFTQEKGCVKKDKDS